MTNTTAYQHLQTTVMRGGRLTKWKGIAASVAPMVGTIVVAGGLALTSPTALFAGTCTETTGGSGIWTCAGPAGLDTPLNLTSASGGDLDGHGDWDSRPRHQCEQLWHRHGSDHRFRRCIEWTPRHQCVQQWHRRAERDLDRHGDWDEFHWH